MSNKIRIYLAGTIYKDPPDSSWKIEFTSYLSGRPLFNPLPKNETEKGKSYRDPSYPDIYEYFDPDPCNEPDLFMVPRDKAEIEKCDIFVAYIQRPTFGTAMEIMYASLLNTKPIFVINPNLSLAGDLWIEYHVHKICASVKDCCEHIKTMRF